MSSDLASICRRHCFEAEQNFVFLRLKSDIYEPQENEILRISYCYQRRDTQIKMSTAKNLRCDFEFDFYSEL